MRVQSTLQISNNKSMQKIREKPSLIKLNNDCIYLEKK